MTQEMFDALLLIIDAKIATLAARDSSDGGLSETIHQGELILDFEQRFVIKED